MVDEREIKTEYTVPEMRNGSLMVKRIVNTLTWSDFKRQYVETNRDTSYVPFLEAHPELSKEAEINILIHKSVIDTHTLEPLSGYFKAKIYVKIPEGRNAYVSICDGLPFLHEIIGKSVVTQVISIQNKQLCTFNKKEERVSIEEANRLISEGTQVYTKVNGEYRLRL